MPPGTTRHTHSYQAAGQRQEVLVLLTSLQWYLKALTTQCDTQCWNTLAMVLWHLLSSSNFLVLRLETPAQMWQTGQLEALLKDLTLCTELLDSLLILNHSGKICTNRTRVQRLNADSTDSLGTGNCFLSQNQISNTTMYLSVTSEKEEIWHEC